MGLDSVELVVKVEDFFRITIPDPEAETILTIQQMTDTVAKYRNITAEEKTLQASFFQQVKMCLPGKDFNMQDKIISFIGTGKQDYKALAACLRMNVPFPDYVVVNDGKRFIDKIKRFIDWQPSYDAKELIFENLVDAILASNYTAVIQPSSLTTKYEIYIAVAGITVDQTGVDYYEIAPGKSFVTDLGID